MGHGHGHGHSHGAWGGAVRTSAFCRGATKGEVIEIVVGVLWRIWVLVFFFFLISRLFFLFSLVMP